ncbi:hypothetical protein J3U01_09480 [Bifidobacterium sp. B4107]|nr:hypothetical protein [Bifidobacterium sp. B4107]MCX8652828.1 hypothetical protein [Bifidobacterium sp. B4111]MCX8659273.1 hypothetical protein [Bifidobacterium sp. B4114]
MKHRKRNGNSELRGATKRNLKADISHFLPYFKGKPVAEIRPGDVRAWYEADHPEGPWAFYGACQCGGYRPRGIGARQCFQCCTMPWGRGLRNGSPIVAASDLWPCPAGRMPTVHRRNRTTRCGRCLSACEIGRIDAHRLRSAIPFAVPTLCAQLFCWWRSGPRVPPCRPTIEDAYPSS